MRKVIWAVDAFNEDRKLESHLIALLKAWVKGTSATIEPVYVLSPDHLKVSPSFFPSKSGTFRLEAENLLKKHLNKVKIPGLAAATILVSSDMSLSSASRSLIEYAKNNGADVIALSTLSRKGMTRFLLGSFAETMILNSPVPIVIVSPKSKIPSSVKEILFPVDFSKATDEALNHVLALAKVWKAKIILFHQVEYLTQFSAYAFETAEAYRAYFEDELKAREKKLSKLEETLKGQGFKVEVRIGKKGKFAAESILAESKKLKSGLLAMASQSGPVSGAVLGSVTRQVVRTAAVPVWVVHPKK